MKNLSIVIPCYNESEAIPNLFNICRKCCEDRNDIEFIFVDNGSTDSTNLIFNELLSNPLNIFAKLVSIKKNIGYGNGIIQGLNSANGKILAWTHADLQTDPKDVVLAYEKYKECLFYNLCIVKRNRIKRNVFDQFFTFGMSLFSSFMLKKKLFDVNAQPKIFNKIFYKDLINPPNDFSLDLFLLYSALDKGLTINSFPVIFKNRHSGIAKGGGTLKGKIKLINRTFNYILSLRRKLQNK